MAENSAIEWTDHTFNPWEGCQKVGPGCDHCYAETRNARYVAKDSPLYGTGVAPNWGPGAPRRRTSLANWRKPLRWQADAGAFLAAHGRRQRVFCASLADVFDNAVDPAWRVDLFDLIRKTPNLDWLLLTKRIGNAASMVGYATGRAELPDNVWLGATIVNQVEADRDIPKLLATPARVRFLSMEPLLGAVTLGTFLWNDLPGHTEAQLDHIDWVIVGGESGPGARITPIDGVRGLRDQCSAAGVAFLHKQHGEWVHESQLGWLSLMLDTHNYRWELVDGESYYLVGKKAAGRLLDGVKHDGFPV